MNKIAQLLSFFFISLLTAATAGAETPSSLEAESQTPSQSRQWLATGAGLFLGFGLGHAIENRQEEGAKFVIADSVGLAVATIGALAVMGDCAPSRESCSRNPTIGLQPSSDGQGAVTTAMFRF